MSSLLLSFALSHPRNHLLTPRPTTSAFCPSAPMASRSTSTSRPARSRTGPPRATPSRTSRSRATPSFRGATTCTAGTRANTGSAATRRFGDKPTGTLTCVPFKVTHPLGQLPRRRRAACDGHVRRAASADNGKVFYRASRPRGGGPATASSSTSSKYKGKDIFIRLVDKHTGHWGHVNFDDFRFHDEKPTSPRGRKAAAGTARRVQVRRAAARRRPPRR